MKLKAAVLAGQKAGRGAQSRRVPSIVSSSIVYRGGIAFKFLFSKILRPIGRVYPPGSMSKSEGKEEEYIWQDREIRFDCQFGQLKPRRGEVEIDSINSVEDTKGNNGEKGALSITNLRVIWCSHKEPKT